MNSPESIAVVAETTCGKLEGAQRGGVCVFKGIPFATARRWHAPEAVAPWSGTRPARHYANMAPQNPTQLQGLLGTGGGTTGGGGRGDIEDARKPRGRREPAGASQGLAGTARLGCRRGVVKRPQHKSGSVIIGRGRWFP